MEWYGKGKKKCTLSSKGTQECHQIVLSWPVGMSHQQSLGDSRQAKNKSQVSSETRRAQMRIFLCTQWCEADCKVRKAWWETKSQRTTSVYTKLKFKGVCDFITQHGAFPREAEWTLLAFPKDESLPFLSRSIPLSWEWGSWKLY